MEFNTKEELLNFLTELQGTIANLQEQMDKIAPVTVDEETPATATETSPDEVTDEEVNEIDALLQGQ